MIFRLFPSLFEKPQKIKFENQEQDEKIELFLRRHWITNVPWVFTSFLAIIFPVIAIQLDSLLNINFIPQVPTQLLIPAFILYYMLILAYALESFLFWYFNVDIITNKHIIDINFPSLLSRQINEIGLEDIESVSRKSGGILDALFNFGTVSAQTAAESHNILIEHISNPDFVVDIIQDLREARKLFYEGDEA